jgi:hypothetical protein
LLNVPSQFSSTVIVIENCAEALPHQVMISAAAPAVAARIPLCHQPTFFFMARSFEIRQRPLVEAGKLTITPQNGLLQRVEHKAGLIL